MSSDAKLHVTTSKERPQMQILTDMNLSSFQKKCGMRSENTKKKKKFKMFLTNHFQQAR